MSRDPLVSLPRELRGGARPSPKRFILGVDGGATKTLAAVLDLQDHAVYLGHGGPSNEDAVGSETAVQSLLDAAQDALGRSHAHEDELAAAVLAIAGTDEGSVRRNVRRARGDWTVVNDVIGAWATATGAGPGIAVIAGTGSNVFGVGPKGSWRAGGWGHLLGDEASGYWLGVQSIKAALAEREDSGPKTALSAALTSFFETDSVEAVANLVYSKPLTKGEIAAFAVETGRVAQDGDEVARGLYERGARELAPQVAAVIRQTGLAGERFPVGLIGSIFRVGALLVDPLTAAIHELAPDASVATEDMEPVGGSLLLAARAAGREDEVPIEQLREMLAAAIAAAGSPSVR